jgi:exodeoxyribonuclease VII large subunit
MLNSQSAKIQSVSELTRSIRGLLETEFPFVSVSGEISNLRKPYSGHLYFTLKDSDAQLRTVLFKQQQRYLDVVPEDGLQVVCRGRISIYEPRGEYQLIVDTLELLGSGKLQAAFERLKSALDAEGLFDAAAKTALPLFPSKVTLVTSPEGAAVHDFIKTAQRRYPGFPIEVFPSRVQGNAAADDIVEAITVLNQKKTTDIIILCRGGGSLEDLWAFNEEKLARAIYDSTIPVVSAVGHEIDFTIADFVADLRAATPTAAAEAIIPDKNELLTRINRLDHSLAESLARLIDSYRYRISSHRRLLGDPTVLVDNFGLRLKSTVYDMVHILTAQLNNRSHDLQTAKTRLYEANPQRLLAGKRQNTAELYRLTCLLIRQRLEREKGKLRRYASLLDAVSPLAVLGRGYSVTMKKEGKEIVRDSRRLASGDDIEIILDQGMVAAKVTEIFLSGKKNSGDNG